MKRTHSILFVAIVVVLSSCGNRKFLTEDMSYLFLDYDSYAQNNIGTRVKGTVSAQMQTGEALPLKNNQGFNSSDNIHVRVNDEEFSIYTTLPSFKTNRIPITLTYTDKKNNTITSNDTVYLNFTGNAEYFGYAERGISGTNGTDGGTSLLLRYGNDGNPGMDGQMGLNANDLEIHVWRSSDTTFFYLQDVVTKSVSRFLIIGTNAQLFVDAYGGTGGSGGDGVNGGTGKNGENVNNKLKLPGAGGRGGQGGRGGTGGKGANVTVTLHPSVTEVEKVMIIYNGGGNGGSGGKGGAGGKAGTPLTGQSAAPDGQKGADGFSGTPGIDGQTIMLTQEFDISQYNK